MYCLTCVVDFQGWKMKKLIITLISVLALSITFTGCGDSAGSISSNANTPIAEDIVAGEADIEVAVTTPSTPYNLSSKLGTPPGLPTK